MQLEYEFPCGCKFKQFGTEINETGLPSLELDLYNLPHCPSTYRMLQEGKTKGVFQLESSLGHTWCKKLSPNNILDLAALISVIRPGVLKSFVDGKSMTQHFCDRKNGREDVVPLDLALTEILRDTYQIQVYQEDSIRIAMEIAGFDEVSGDRLRKAIGTKDAEIMNSLEEEFISGCKKVRKVSDEMAKQIFSWIRESQKYSFNKCLSPNSIVETKEGLKMLKDIHVKELIKAPSDNLMDDNFVEVLNKYDNGIQEVHEMTTESGKQIVCTIDHKLMCEDGILRPVWEILQNNYKIICEDD